MQIQIVEITGFDPQFARRLPETRALLASAGLAVHPRVVRVTLHGSRGLAQNARPDSDVDLGLLVPYPSPPEIGEALARDLREVLQVTLSGWKSAVEADLAAIFPRRPACRFACFRQTAYDPSLCPAGGVDCFGVYKIQKAYSGFIVDAGLQVQRMYPCITVWEQEHWDSPT